jgi:predicted PhzF superfamily epimerase YddE/YHI9
MLEKERDQITIVLKAGSVQATFDRKSGKATAAIPHDFHQHASNLTWDNVVRSQPGLASQAMQTAQPALVSIVKGVSFGLIDLTVEPDLLDRIAVTNDDIPKQHDLDEGWREGLIGDLFYVHKPDAGDGVVRVQQRMIGIGLEDPATGAASCALCAYLSLNRRGIGRKHIFELEQGVQMGRRSITGCKVTLNEHRTGIESILLSGQSKPVMSGRTSVPEAE